MQKRLSPPTGWTAGRRTCGAFTLIELLVVIVILVILTGIAITLATRVTSSGRGSATANIIKSLDATLTVYMTEKEKFPSFYEDGQGEKHYLVDGRGNNGAMGDDLLDKDRDFAEPTMALYALIASDLPDIAETLQGLDTTFAKLRQFDFLEPTDTDAFPNSADNERSRPTDAADLTRFDRRIRTTGSGGVRTVRDGEDRFVPGVFVHDAFGRPIRFVHPRFDGGHGNFFDDNGMGQMRPLIEVDSGRYSRSFRRANPLAAAESDGGDADEGICPSNQPYFYSVGADGDAGTREDNIYTTVPKFPSRTADLSTPAG